MRRICLILSMVGLLFGLTIGCENLDSRRSPPGGNPNTGNQGSTPDASLQDAEGPDADLPPDDGSTDGLTDAMPVDGSGSCSLGLICPANTFCCESLGTCVANGGTCPP